MNQRLNPSAIALYPMMMTLLLYPGAASRPWLSETVHPIVEPDQILSDGRLRLTPQSPGHDMRVEIALVAAWTRGIDRKKVKGRIFLFPEFEQKVAVPLDFLLKLQEAIHQRLCSWWASRNVNVHGHNAIAASNDGI